jgi:uncharacterized membrane protein
MVNTVFMLKQNHKAHLEEDVCIHIFTVSAAMVGVCLTVISLLRVVNTLRRANSLADDLIAADAIMFLVSCLSSYWALRTRSKIRMHRLERFADFAFIVAMIFMVAISLFITYEIALINPV